MEKHSRTHTLRGEMKREMNIIPSKSLTKKRKEVEK